MGTTTDTMLPVKCEMVGCSNPVEDPANNTVVVEIFKSSSITIPCCSACRKRLNAPSSFNYYSMN